MENPSHSRHPSRSKKIYGNAAAATTTTTTRSMYDDVYGGPPKFSAAAARTNLSPRMEDYSEIFGSFQASRVSSIPVLDLPAVDESEVFFDVRSSGFDYSEVFGRGYEGLDFAVSYEDLVNGDSSFEAWSPAEFESMSDESDASGKDLKFSNGGSHYQVDSNTEFSISYHQARPMSNEDVSNGMAHVAQIHAVPGYSFMVDSPSQLKEDKMTANSYLDMDFSAETMRTKQTKNPTSVSLHDSTDEHGFENNLRTQKGQEKDGSSSRTSFLDISKISLRTQPSDLPPPSRPPPVVGGKKGDFNKVASKSNASVFEGISGASSPTFFDVEVDASSSAAVSAAAIKEAMAKAQVKLKSAKELMDKKKEGLQGTYKLGSKKYMKEKAGETGIFTDGSLRVKDEKLKDTSERDGGGAKFVSREEKKKASETEVSGILHSEMLRPLEKLVEDKHKESRLSSGSYKTDETSEWNEAADYFELITADDVKKDFEQANCSKNSAPKEQIDEHKPMVNKAIESSGEQSNNGVKVKTGSSNEVEENKEKGKVEISRHKEPIVKSNDALEMKVHGKNLPPSLQIFEGIENKVFATVTDLSAPNKRIPVTDKSLTEKETDTQPTPITCNSDESSELAEETCAREKSETLNNEVLLGITGKETEVPGKCFEASSTSDNGYTGEAHESFSSDWCVMKTSGEIKREYIASDDSGVFEIEDLLLGEDLKAFGNLQEDSDGSVLLHPENQVKDTTLVGSVFVELCAEQDESSSAESSDSVEKVRKSSQKCKESGEDLTQVQVSQNQEKQGIESANECRVIGEDERVSLNSEDEDGTNPTSAIKESSEDIKKVEADQPMMVVEEKQKNKITVQQVNATQIITEIIGGVYGEVDAANEVREIELENQMLKKVDEEQESERDGEREAKPNDPKSVQQVNTQQVNAQQVNAEQTTKMEETKKSEKLGTERENRERETENQRLGMVEKERERNMESEMKPMNQKSAQQVNASQVNEMKEKTNAVVDNLREKRERKVENPRLRKLEEEREKEKEVKPNIQISKQVSQTDEIKSDEVGTAREKRERELENQRPRKIEEERERERCKEKEREVEPKNRKSTEQVKASQTTERTEKKIGDLETERKHGEREPEKERLRNAEDEKKREEKQKNKKSAQQLNRSKTTDRKEKASSIEVENERTRKERENERERLKRIEEERDREREREKDRMAVDLATLEARERAVGETRDRAERAAVERATTEARQRAMAEARERLEKACAEAREKSLAGKSTTDARIRAERAAVERATSEARERAAEKAALEAKDRVHRSVSDKFSASSRSNGLRQSSSSSDLQDQSSGVPRYQYSSVYGERYGGGEGESAQRCKARSERDRRTSERGAKALAEKNMRDLVAQREQAERNRLAETLDADVRRWSSGKEGNLRALLSTLQYILGPEGGWQPIPLTEVITSAAVKKAYRKATLCVHPDKLQQRGASIQQKYVCEKVFDLLKEAWNKFNSEER